MTGKHERIRLEILDHDSVAHFGSGADLYAATHADWLDVFEDSNASFAGGLEAFGEMATLHSEEDSLGPLDSDLSFDDGEESSFSHTFDSAEEAKKGVMPREILEFEDHALQWSALAIYQAVHTLYKTIHRPEECADVAQWLFGFSFDKDSTEVSFEQCCEAHSARPDVVRLKIMFELWRLGKYATEPLELEHYSLPDPVFSSVFIDHGIHAQRLANTLWTFPGATIQQLRELLSKKELNALPVMAQKYMASPTYGEPDPEKQRWYLTGINPILSTDDVIRPTLNRQKRLELSWSRYFPD